MKKTIAFCLAILLTFQICGVSVSARASDTDDVYTGAILAAVNTNYDDLLQDFTAEPLGGAQTTAAAQAQAGPADELLDGPQEPDPVPLTAAEAKAKEAALGKNAADAAPKADYRVGDRKTVYSMEHLEYDTNMIDLECIYTNDLCTVWREDGIPTDAQKCIDVAEQFCALLPREWELFGDKRIDADGDGKIALFFQTMDSGVGGYFASGDLVDKLGRIGSVWVSYKGTGNACDCVHLYPYADFNTVLHEYQHYLHCSWKYAGKNNLTCIYNDHESYFNEGFSGCAEALLGTHDRSTGFRWAAENPGEYSMVNWSFNGSSYTLSYAFCQYMRTRYALLTNDLDSEIPGSGFFREILKTRSEKYVRNTLTIAANLLYPKAQYPELKTADSRCRELIKDFWIAVLRKDASGIHGFNGEEWARNLVVTVTELPVQDGRKLRSGMAAFCRIPSDDPLAASDGSARVTRTGGEIRFVGVGNVGKTLLLDPNDARLPVQKILSLSDEISLERPEDYFVSGRSFLGWSSDPQSSAVQYSFRAAVPLSEESTTLYGVWADAPTLTEKQSALLSRYSLHCIRFTPETDGYYVFNPGNATIERAETNGEILEPEWTDDYGENRCYALQAGEPVDLCVINAYSYSTRVRVQRVENQYTLCYQVTLDGETVTETIGGNVSYRLNGMDDDTNQRAMKNDLRFLGWSETPDAQTAAYRANAFLTLHADTTLYAVWGSVPTLQEGVDTQETTVRTAVNFEACDFTFTPQTSGTYFFTCAADGEVASSVPIRVYDADQNLLRTLPLDENENVCSCCIALQGGKKYRFNFAFYDDAMADPAGDTCTLRIDKFDDMIYTQFSFYIPEASGTAFDSKEFRMDRLNVYTIPDWKLGQKSQKSLVRLVGWSVDPDDPRETVYHAGDQIEPLCDMTLLPVLESVPKTRWNSTFIAFVWNNLCAYLRLAKIRLSGQLQ